MTLVVGIDGAPGQNWAVVILDSGRLSIHKIAERDLSNFLGSNDFKIVAIDVPIGLLDSYDKGGRLCDREARKLLGSRRNSVFSAPIRSHP
jgi:predicted RNase H-like nuclease